MPYGYHEYPVNAEQVVPPSRHPFQLWMMAACLFSGVAYMAGVAAGSVVVEEIPNWTSFTWGALLTYSGLTAIIAAYMKDRVLGLLLEKTALRTLQYSCILWGLTQFYLVGGTAAFSVCFTLSAGMASRWRAKHVNRDLHSLSAWLKEHG